MSGLDLRGRKLRKGAGDAVRRWVTEAGGDWPQEIEDSVTQIAEGGGTPLPVAVEESDGTRRVIAVVQLSDVVKPGMAERFAELRRLAADDAAWDAADPPAASEQQRRVRAELNSSTSEPSGDVLHTGFLANAAAHPDAPAVFSNAGNLSYGELREKVLAVAAALQSRGVCRGEVVAVLGPKSVEQVIALRPDRIALYAYAHLPTRFKPQRRINEIDLPPRATRVGLLSAAIDGFLKQGYSYIGMDHFALDSDSLAVAKRRGELHRNFQGYSTQPDRDLVALGVSAIGRIGDTYSQNAKDLDTYYAAIESGRFAVERGLALSEDDLVRREIIMDIMCQGRVDFARIEARHRLRFGDYFSRELEQMTSLAELGLVELQQGALRVTGLGWYFVRAVAMAFDGYLQSAASGASYSRII